MAKDEMEVANVIRTSQGLRDAVFDEIDDLRNGRSNPQKAGALAKLSMQIVNTVRLEIEHHKFVASMPATIEGKASVVAKPAVLSLGG